MGHPIHKHMNSFKAKNLLSEMPIDDKASALEMDKGSAAYMKEDEGSPAKHVKYTKKNIEGKDQVVPTQHNHTQRGGATKNTSIKGTRANTEKAAAKAKKAKAKAK